MKVVSGKMPGPKKVVIYGPEGIGKSTFASKFPGAVFIDTEGSTKEMDVLRAEIRPLWSDVIDAVKFLIDSKEYKTIVIDTADWTENLCIEYTCQKANLTHIEDFGYGKGYTYVQENFRTLLDLCNVAIEMGINVVFTAHAKMRKFEQPDEMGAYDRWEMKLSKQVAPMLKEWADMVLFANYKTYVVTDDKTKSKKAQGGKRVMYTSHHPCWDAKNRYNLADCIPFEYEEIRHIIEGPGKKTEKAAEKTTEKPEPKKEAKPKKAAEKKPLETSESKKPVTEELPEKKKMLSPEHMELQELMMRDGISRKRLEYAVATKGAYFIGDFDDYDPEFIRNSLINKWAGFVRYAKKFTKEEIEAETMPFDQMK